MNYELAVILPKDAPTEQVHKMLKPFMEPQANQPLLDRYHAARSWAIEEWLHEPYLLSMDIMTPDGIWHVYDGKTPHVVWLGTLFRAHFYHRVVPVWVSV